MLNLSKNWWLLVLRGVMAILFGMAAFLMPGIAWLSLILLFGVYAVVDGVFAMLSGVISSKYSPRWWVFLLEGIVSVAAGVIALLRPDLAGTVLILLIAAWAVVTGILEIAAAIRLRREITNEWMLGFGGFVSIVLGVVLFLQPTAGGLIITLMIGVYALIFGILLVVLGFRLRKWNSLGSEKDTLRAMRF
ncbi:MAG TPA: HdeD family acid-resistance protein [Anaerolineales bacterium]|nr:HdeD family acid-resistance protein [Anaerolineales bacterium]